MTDTKAASKGERIFFAIIVPLALGVFSASAGFWMGALLQAGCR